MIRVEGFGWRFAGANAWALRDVSLRIGRGEFVAVAGASGSGKSTLAQAMCGLLMGRQAGEREGDIFVADRDVAAAPLHETAETIGLVQQNPETHFATLTVSDEIAFGMENRCLPPEHIREHGEKAMELLSISHLRDRDLATLSGGEKQRVAVASIVAGEPDVLVLDEPTASLDPQASSDLFHSLARLCRESGLTVVIIEHKLALLLPLRPRLVCLEHGRVKTDVPTGEVDEAKIERLTGPVVARARSAATDSVTGSVGAVVDVAHLTVELGGSTILRDLSLQVRCGEVISVMGPNGGGKSTLLGALMGLVQPASGSIDVCDVSVSPSVVSRLARDAGLVFQNADHQLFADTVWNEALFAARNLGVSDTPREHQASRLLERAGLSDRKEDHPYRLSWGQKRRLNLISAVVHGPRLLLLDEPFAGQDWENVMFLLDVIRGVVDRARPERVGSNPRADKPSEETPAVAPGACLMVTHDPRVVLQTCTRVLFISAGRLIVDATVAEAFHQLRQMGHEAYVPVTSSLPPAVNDGSGLSRFPSDDREPTHRNG